MEVEQSTSFRAKNKILYTKLVRHFLPPCLILYITSIFSRQNAKTIYTTELGKQTKQMGLRQLGVKNRGSWPVYFEQPNVDPSEVSHMRWQLLPSLWFLHIYNIQKREDHITVDGLVAKLRDEVSVIKTTKSIELLGGWGCYPVGKVLFCTWTACCWTMYWWSVNKYKGNYVTPRATAVLHHWEEQNLPRDPIPGAGGNNAVLPIFNKEGSCTQATRWSFHSAS